MATDGYSEEGSHAFSWTFGVFCSLPEMGGAMGGEFHLHSFIYLADALIQSDAPLREQGQAVPGAAEEQIYKTHSVHGM